MTTARITPSTIRAWAASELPATPIPDEATLSSLCAGSAAQSLWRFLTSRVKSRTNAENARAACALVVDAAKEKSVGDKTLEELGIVETELAKVEEEIAELQKEIKNCGADDATMGTGLKMEELKEGWREVLGEVEKEVEKKVGEALRMCERVRWREDEEEERVLIEGRRELEKILDDFEELVNNLEDEGMEVGDEVEAIEERLKAVCERVCLEDVVDVLEERRMKSMEVIREIGVGLEGEDVEGVKEEVAKDEVLKAFAEYERVVREVRRAEEALEKETVSEGVEIEGEKALLAFCRKEREVGNRDEVRRMKMEVRRRNERIERMDKAGRRLVEGNWKLLREGREIRERTGRRDVGNVRKVEGIVREIERIREWIGENEVPGRGMGIEVMGSERVGMEGVNRRRWEIAREEEERNEKVVEVLQLRADVAVEAREQVWEEMEEGLFTRIEEAKREGERCRDEEATKVMEELGNWEGQTIREIAKRLGLVEVRTKE